MDFADDIAMLSTSLQKLQEMTTKLQNIAAKVGLRISCSKTKIMHALQENHQSIIIDDETLEEVQHFQYLGSYISIDGTNEEDIKNRSGKATSTFQRMQKIWNSKSISLSIKFKLYSTTVLPIAIYASETWKTNKKDFKKLSSFHLRCIRKILGITYKDRVTNEKVLELSGQPTMQNIISKRRLRYTGHVLRYPDTRHPKTALHWTPPDGKRSRGRPRHTWRRSFVDDLRALNITLQEAETTAADRESWRNLVDQFITDDDGGTKV